MPCVLPARRCRCSTGLYPPRASIQVGTPSAAIISEVVESRVRVTVLVSRESGEDYSHVFRVLALFAASLCFALLASEAILRLAGVEATLERPTHPGWEWLVSDPLLGYRNRPFHQAHGWRINSLGFRGPELADSKPPGTQRIVCIGDSGTFGLWKKAAGEDPAATLAWDTYVEWLQLTLSERARRPVEVINAGVLGYTSAHGLRQLVTRILPLDPDVVTVRLGLNDYGIARLPALLPREPRSPLLRFLFYRGAGLASFRLAAYAYRRMPAGDPAMVVSRAMTVQDFERNLQRLADVAHAAGIHLVFVDYPLRALDPNDSGGDPLLFYLFGFKDFRELYALHAIYQQALRRVASERDVPLVETTTELAGSPIPSFSPFDRFHPNDVGAKQIGQLLADRLLALHWVE
jgi:lysophospholipase L1-like esterase